MMDIHVYYNVLSCDYHVTYILEDLPGALCRLYEGHVVVEG